jgi:hypothetical protein
VGALPLQLVLDAFDDPTVAIVPLVGAAHRGAPLKNEVVRPLLEQSHDSRAFAAYASLGEREARFALAIAPENSMEIAKAALLHTPALGFRLLMEHAIGDDKSTGDPEDRPMRLLRDHLAQPSGRLEQRRELAGVVAQWVSENMDPDVALRAVCCALNPGFETTTLDPGEGTKITIHSGILPVPILKEIAMLWRETLQLITMIRCRTYKPLLDVIGGWVFPSRVTFSPTAPDAEYSFMRKEAARLIRELAKRFRWHRGVTASLARLARRGELGVTVSIDREFDALFPEEEFGPEPSDYQANLQRQLDSALTYAESIQTLDPKEVAGRISAVEREATEAGITWPRFTLNVCTCIAEHTSAPHELANAFRDAAVDENLLVPFLSAVAKQRPEGWEALLLDFLEHDRCWRSAVAVCLTQPVNESLQAEAVRRCDWSLVNYLRMLIARDELDEGTFPGLLDHPDRNVVQAVAIGLGTSGRSLPPGTQKKWETAIVRCPADDHWYAVILKSRHSLLVTWVEAWLVRQASPQAPYEPIPDKLLDLIAELKAELKEQLLDHVPAKPYHPSISGLVTRLVGDDDGLATVLFGRAELKHYHEAALTGSPTPSWLKRASVALNHGWSPKDVVAACTSGLSIWSGPESAHWEAWVKGFEELGRGRGRRAKLLSEAGVEYYNSRRDRAVEQERHEAIYGLS